MRSKIRTICLLCLVGFAVAQVCTSPPTLTPADVPFEYDPNDAPARFISWMQIDAGSEYGSEIRACDPDGDPFIIEPVSMPEGMTWDSITNWWHWTATNQQLGNHWLVFKVTDVPPVGDVNSLSDTAAYLVNVRRVTNEPPVLLPFVVQE